ncbi:sensor domain-containing diguanylate cyclase [Fervidobacterium sp.]
MIFISDLPFKIDFDTIKSAISKSKIFILVFDENGSIISASDNAPKMIKKGENLFEIAPEFANIINTVMKNGFSEDILSIGKKNQEKIHSITFKGNVYYWTLGEIITEKLLRDELISQRLETLTMYLEFAPVFFVVLNEEGKIVYVNSWTLEKTGYSFIEVIGKDWFEIFIPNEIKDVVRNVFLDIMAGKVELRQTFENEIKTKDGKLLSVLWENKLIVKDEKPSGTISVGVDITEKKIRDFEEQILIELLSASSETNYHLSLSKMKNVLTENCNILKAVGTIESEGEIKTIELVDNASTNLISSELSEIHKLSFERSQDERILKLEIAYSILPKYASQKCLENIANVLLNFIDRIYYIQKLEEASFRDPLTKLFNRRYFLMMLQAEIRRVKRYGGNSCVVMIDLDGLKRINDTFGHDKGDLAITTLAHTMISNTRNSDVCARFGGDEFAILLPQTSIENAGVTIKRIMKTLDDLDLKEFKVSMSAGITKSPQRTIIRESVY